MRKHLTLLLIASEALFRHKARSLVVMACLIAVLLPFITAIGISEGVKAQSLISVEEGADLYLTLDQFGRNGPIPLTFLEKDGAELFQMKGMASDFLIYCRPGYEGVISKGISWLGPLFRIQSKDLVRQYYLRGFNLKEGIFTALYTVAFALAIPALLSIFFALILTAVGSIYSAWKAATVPPVEAMRW